MSWEVKSAHPSKIVITDGKCDVTIIMDGSIHTDFEINNPITQKTVRVKIGSLGTSETVRMLNQSTAVDEDLAEVIEAMVSNMATYEAYLWDSFKCIKFDDITLENVRAVSITNDNPLGYPESDDRTLVTVSCGHSMGLGKLKPAMGRKNAPLMFIMEDNLVQLPNAMLTGVDISQEYDETKYELNFYSNRSIEILSIIDRPKQEEVIEIPQPSTKPLKHSLLNEKPRILDLD